MKPTLLIGDYIMVVPYNELPKRGDVVVFQKPGSHVAFVQRLIGLPGDQIQLVEGVVYLNDTALPQQPDSSFTEIYRPQGPAGLLPRCGNNTFEFGTECITTRLVETLPDGHAYNILALDDNLQPENGTFDADNTAVFLVPDTSYFFLGDNRDASIDSRFPQSSSGFGFVAQADILGQAVMIIYSSAGTSMLDVWTYRSDRYFKVIE